MIDSKYIAIDVETPNNHNDSVCQIGMSFLDVNFKEIFCISQLIDPKAEFSKINMRIHHITPEDVKGMPTFDEFWEQIGEYFKTSIIICHQHSTDLVVIDKHLNKYGIDLMDYNIRYIDTLEICKNNQFKSNKLEDVCRELEIDTLPAHDAGNDCKMCASLFTYFKNNNYKCEIQDYEGYKSDSRAHLSNGGTFITNEDKFSEETKNIRAILSYLREISADNKITIEELYPIFSWLYDNSDMAGTYQYDKIDATVNGVLNDGFIDEKENEEMCKAIEEIINPKKTDGFFMSDDTVIEFTDKKFVITGEFENGWSKEQCQEKIEIRGGSVKKDVSGKTDYLIVGNKGSEAWKYGNYGNKIGKALGFNTPIINEETFIKNVGK